MIGAEPALALINQVLREALLDETIAAMTCRGNMLEMDDGRQGGYEWTLAPLERGATWLTVAVAQTDDCGGAHPNSRQDVWTFDTRNGRRVDVSDWLDGASPAHWRTRVDERLMAAFEADSALADCEGLNPGEISYAMWPTTKGISFSPQMIHGTQACNVEVRLPWAKLRPFLSRMGLAAISASNAIGPSNTALP